MKLKKIKKMKIRFTAGRAGRMIFGLAAILSLAFGLSGCRSKSDAAKTASPAQGTRADETRIVLQAGKSSYSLGDFNVYVRSSVGGETGSLGNIVLSHLFDKFIEEKLFLQAARDQNLSLSAADKEAYLKKAAEGTWTEEERTSFLTSDSGPMVDQMMVDKYSQQIGKDVTVDEKEIRDYYDQNQSQFFFPERVKVSQILLQTEDRAVEVYEKLKFADEDSFRTLARSESIGPEASEGGEMGIFQRGQLPQEMEEAIFALEEGAVSPVIQSSYGFHIFRLDKKFAPESIPLDKAAADIRQKILDLKVQSLVARRLSELQDSLEWAAFPENLSFPYQKVD